MIVVSSPTLKEKVIALFINVGPGSIAKRARARLAQNKRLIKCVHTRNLPRASVGRGKRAHACAGAQEYTHDRP